MAGDKHVVIIGAGFGGLSCARHLAGRPGIRVTIVDRRNHHLFQPLLYQVATSTLTAPDISRSIRTIFDRDENIAVLYEHVESVDLATRSLTMASGGRLEFDKLVIATGSRASFFGNEAWAPHVLQLKSLSDAFEIRKRVLRNLELADRAEPERQAVLGCVVIIGGGPTGVELAGAFSDLIQRTMRRSYRGYDTRRQRIILLEARDRLLGTFDRAQSDYARRRLEKLGVTVRLGAMVSGIEDQRVTLADGEVLEAGAIIWTAGVEATALTRTLGVGLTRAGLIQVEEDLSLPGHPDAYAIGDTAAAMTPDARPVPGVAPAAVQAGKHVGQQILRGTREPFRYLDKGSMAIIGKNAAVVDAAGMRLHGWPAWLIWLLVHVLFLAGFRSKSGVLVSWFWAYIHDKPGSRVFTTASDDEPGGVS
ncbi:NAD(P)/FAD-dependent oxidoreductase [Luteolibacter flavescens]|uniref:NADH:ubiquinone reductase (non-electrogenic) n=1 Tax=Luteolibacter flavescens TaxID=1859460 RepID=A0ABT3FQI2_9BACT|nr:NAD(P)/FAD-dependent oxidoreductase [Luteolibacter flavescens]MCW1885569.1 NAD(P)/FAD-dependent oxidoreductase [Luteolibacter flavescens]